MFIDLSRQSRVFFVLLGNGYIEKTCKLYFEDPRPTVAYIYIYIYIYGINFLFDYMLFGVLNMLAKLTI